MQDPRFPIGPFEAPRDITPETRDGWIEAIACLPEELTGAVAGLSDAQLDTRYRDGGWTVRQVVHHLADSHINSHARFRFALTEERPTIKPYPEDQWAELADAKGAPVEPSLEILRGLHARWVMLLRGFRADDWSRVLIHPEHPEPRDLDFMAALYAWHGRHHTAHITRLREREGW